MTAPDTTTSAPTSEQQTQTGDTSQQQTAADPAAAKPRPLEDLLSDLPEDARKAVLGEVSKARTEAKGLRERLKAAEPALKEHAALVESTRSAEERAEARAKAAEQRAAAAAQRAVKSEVRAYAAKDFTDPDDAAAFLDLDNYVDDDGTVDTAAIQADLADLLTRKPHLGKASERRAPRPDQSQASGAGGSTTPNPAAEFGSILQKAMRG